jgi:hypothetical protein
MKTPHRYALRLGVLALAVLGACRDGESPAGPGPVLPSNVLAVLTCEATVATKSVACRTAPLTTPGLRAQKILGGQDQYVKLRSANTSYDSGTQIFQTDVTVQNLLVQALGTTDGVTPTGVHVFFHTGPTVTGGTGNIEVFNEDGEGTFTGSGQPYFLYNEILSPYEISPAKTWQFAIDATVATFTFQVYVAAEVSDEAVLLDRVWTGAVDTDWFTAGNWDDNAVPDSTNSVFIATAANMPVLNADARVLHLRVASGMTVNQGGFTLRVDGNLDAPGALSNGTTRLTGSGVLLFGNVNALQLNGGTSLQGGNTTATGAVSIADGSLAVSGGNTLTISIP